MPLSTDQFVSIALQNPVNAKLIEILRDLNLPQCTLTAGCLFQSAWNVKSGNAVGWGIKDYDVFYFDDQNLSWEAEDKITGLINKVFDGLGGKVEVRNQARVHLWYSQKFGKDYPQLTSAYDGIDRYLIACTRVGIDVHSGELYAPDGPEDMWDGVLRINSVNAQPDLFRRKCEDYLERWPCPASLASAPASNPLWHGSRMMNAAASQDCSSNNQAAATAYQRHKPPAARTIVSPRRATSVARHSLELGPRK